MESGPASRILKEEPCKKWAGWPGGDDAEYSTDELMEDTKGPKPKAPELKR